MEMLWQDYDVMEINKIFASNFRTVTFYRSQLLIGVAKSNVQSFHTHLPVICSIQSTVTYCIMLGEFYPDPLTIKRNSNICDFSFNRSETESAPLIEH